MYDFSVKLVGHYLGNCDDEEYGIRHKSVSLFHVYHGTIIYTSCALYTVCILCCRHYDSSC